MTGNMTGLLRAVTTACKQMLVSPFNQGQTEAYTTSRIGPRETLHSGCKHTKSACPEGCLSVFSSMAVGELCAVVEVTPAHMR